MRPYLLILLSSVMITIVLFTLDDGPWSFTSVSIAGFIVVGAVYTMVIFGVCSVIYWSARRFFQLLKRQ